MHLLHASAGQLAHAWVPAPAFCLPRRASPAWAHAWRVCSRHRAVHQRHGRRGGTRGSALHGWLAPYGAAEQAADSSCGGQLRWVCSGQRHSRPCAFIGSSCTDTTNTQLISSHRLITCPPQCTQLKTLNQPAVLPEQPTSIPSKPHRIPVVHNSVVTSSGGARAASLPGHPQMLVATTVVDHETSRQEAGASWERNSLKRTCLRMHAAAVQAAEGTPFQLSVEDLRVAQHDHLGDAPYAELEGHEAHLGNV